MPDLVNATRLAHVLDAWASEDDWNVPYLYVSTVMWLYGLLLDGADFRKLAAHASHHGNQAQCSKRGCPKEWSER